MTVTVMETRGRRRESVPCGTAARDRKRCRLLRDHVPRAVPIRPRRLEPVTQLALRKMSHTTWWWLADLALSAIDADLRECPKLCAN